MPEDTIPETLANLLIARELLRANGVGQGRLYEPITGCYCSLGAIYAARTGKRGTEVLDHFTHTQAYSTTPEVEVLAKAMKMTGLAIPFVPEDAPTVWSYNDNATEEEVLTAWDQAIELLTAAEPIAA